MNVEDAGMAVRKFLKVTEEAQDMMTARATGSVLNDVMRHAGDLLDMLEEELQMLDLSKHASLFAAAPILRQKLERLQAELPGGATN